MTDELDVLREFKEKKEKSKTNKDLVIENTYPVLELKTQATNGHTNGSSNGHGNGLHKNGNC